MSLYNPLSVLIYLYLSANRHMFAHYLSHDFTLRHFMLAEPSILFFYISLSLSACRSLSLYKYKYTYKYIYI